MSGIVYICEACGGLLDEHESVTEAVRLLDAGGGDLLEGHHVFFHPRHYPSGARDLRLVVRTTTVDESLRRLGDR